MVNKVGKEPDLRGTLRMLQKCEQNISTEAIYSKHFA